MSDPRQLLNAHAAKDYGEYSDRLDEIAPEAFSALHAVLDIHTPYAPPEGAKWISGGKTPHCEGCSNGNPFDDEPWPCPTVQAITAALEGV